MATQDVRILDSSGNPVDTTDLSSGRALRVVNLGVQAVRGKNAAGDDISAQKPVMIGAFCANSIANGTPVTEGQLNFLKAAADGRLVTLAYSNPEDVLTGTATSSDGSVTQVLAAVASRKIYLTWVHLVNTHASSGCFVQIKDGATVRDTIYVKASDSKEVTYPTPLPGTASTAWNFDPSASVDSIVCTVGGYKTQL